MGFRKLLKAAKNCKMGMLVGLFLGLLYIPFGLGVGSSTDSFFVLRILFMLFDLIYQLYARIFCWIFSFHGEGCVFTSLYYGLLVIPIFLIIIGGLIGYLVKKK